MCTAADGSLILEQTSIATVHFQSEGSASMRLITFSRPQSLTESFPFWKELKRCSAFSLEREVENDKSHGTSKTSLIWSRVEMLPLTGQWKSLDGQSFIDMITLDCLLTAQMSLLCSVHTRTPDTWTWCPSLVGRVGSHVTKRDYGLKMKFL